MAVKRGRAVRRRAPTPFQTVGPFFPHAFCPPEARDLTRPATGNGRAKGEPIYVSGQVLQKGGGPVPDAVVEIWQADAAGVFAHAADPRGLKADPAFKGFGRAAADAQGRYSFLTVKPGAYPLPGTNLWRPPHIDFAVYAAGVTRRLFTVMYFADETLNETDPLLGGLESDSLRERLITRPETSRHAPAGVPAYRFDIVLMGRGETPFFAE